MKIPNKKSILPYLLAVCAIIIWGHNGYKIFRGVFSADDVPEIENINEWNLSATVEKSGSDEQLFVYRADYRDPFRGWLRATKKTKSDVNRKQRIKTSLPTPPPLRLTGIVMDSSGPMAIIETPSREIKFVREKDIIAGIQIVTIDSSWISCRFEKQKFRLWIK
jgi:hypothetical protein